MRYKEIRSIKNQPLNEAAPLLLIPPALAVGRVAAPAIARFFSSLTARFGQQTAKEVAKKAGYAGSAAAAAGIAKVATDQPSADQPVLTSQQIDSAIQSAQQKAQQAGMSMSPALTAATTLANTAINRITGTPSTEPAVSTDVNQTALARAGQMTGDREDAALGQAQTQFATRQDREESARRQSTELAQSQQALQSTGGGAGALDPDSTTRAAQRATGAAELDRFNRKGQANQLQQAETDRAIAQRRAQAEQNYSDAVEAGDRDSMATYRAELERLQQLAGSTQADGTQGETAARRIADLEASNAEIDQAMGRAAQAELKRTNDAAAQQGAVISQAVARGQQSDRREQADQSQAERASQDRASDSQLIQRAQAELKRTNDAAALSGAETSAQVRSAQRAAERDTAANARDRDEGAVFRANARDAAANARDRDEAIPYQGEITAAQQRAADYELDKIRRLSQAQSVPISGTQPDDRRAAPPAAVPSSPAGVSAQPASGAVPGSGVSSPPAAIPTPVTGTGAAAVPVTTNAQTAAPPVAAVAPPAIPPVPPPPPVTPTSVTAGGKEYATLSQIAQKYNTNVDALMRANPNIRNADAIQAGQKINLPAATERTGGSVYAGGVGTAADTAAKVASGQYQDYLSAQRSVATTPIPEPPAGGSQITAGTWSLDDIKESLSRIRQLAGLK
jgi:LysM repeat protein